MLAISPQDSLPRYATPKPFQLYPADFISYPHLFCNSKSTSCVESRPLPPRLHTSALDHCSSLKAGTASIVIKKNVSELDAFNTLPVVIHLHIFSFLDVRSLCRLAQTCSYMEQLTSDPILWTHLLESAVLQWSVLGHLSHPKVYQDAATDLTPKQVYSQCYSHRCSLPQRSFTHPLTTRLKSFVRKIQGHVPKVVVFGSGMETLPFVRKLFWDDKSPYKPIGLYPGKDGIGSGVCIEHRNSTPVNLINLYTSTKAEREIAHMQPSRIHHIQPAPDKDGSVRINKLITSNQRNELTRAVHDLCTEADAFILVVDATSLAPARDSSMLKAMLRSASFRTPLLVLSATSHTISTLTCVQVPVQVAETLSLCSLTNPWQVRSLDMDTFLGIEQGFEWLLRTATY